jgi:hypothetical protein
MMVMMMMVMMMMVVVMMMIFVALLVLQFCYLIGIPRVYAFTGAVGVYHAIGALHRHSSSHVILPAPSHTCTHMHTQLIHPRRSGQVYCQWSGHVLAVHHVALGADQEERPTSPSPWRIRPYPRVYQKAGPYYIKLLCRAQFRRH